MQTYRLHPLLLSIIGGLLMFLAWPPLPASWLAFFGFVPLLYIERETKSTNTYFGYTYLSLFIWNALTTWWIWNSTPPGAVAAIIANSWLMTLPWMGYRFVKKRLGILFGYTSLVVFWMSFEYLHLQDWGLSWPWLTLGNVFAKSTNWIQWYEYTGVSGGTLWILLFNILFFDQRTRTNDFEASEIRKRFGILSLLLLAPILLSLFIKTIHTEKGSDQSFHVVVVQPNIDPYTEKFNGSLPKQLEKLIRVSESKMNDSTSLVIWPETAIPAQAWEEQINDNPEYEPVREFLRRHPHVTLLTGIDSYRTYPPSKEKPTVSARKFSSQKDMPVSPWYDAYNTAAMFTPDSKIQLYHKSMLVPGVETLPRYLQFLASWFEDFGGITGSLGSQSERTVLETGNGLRVAPAICYESIYGEFLTSYIRGGANVISILTNDGWWGNTPGHQQHMVYARLRAIENRRYVLRSANTGISCIINTEGKILEQHPWDQEAAIGMNIPVFENLTFYARFGDLLSKIALVIATGLFLWTIFTGIRKR